MAFQITLEMGSSRFRGELVPGLRQLLRGKLYWHPDGLASGHDGCTLCTSRLLFVFASAYTLLSTGELQDLVEDVSGRGLGEAMRGILRYFIARSRDDLSWWGVGDQTVNIRSPEYLAWAAWSAAFCLDVDDRLRTDRGEHWLRDTLALDEDAVVRLARERCTTLFDMTLEGLFSSATEEPFFRSVGAFAQILLKILNLPPGTLNRILSNTVMKKSLALHGTMDKAILHQSDFSEFGRFAIWPAAVLLDRLEGGQSAERTRELTETCMGCINSPIWIRRGSDAGTWGFNVKSTQQIVDALATFWRHALAANNRARFEEAFLMLTNSEPREEPHPAS
jgi:hypothetical protein